MTVISSASTSPNARIPGVAIGSDSPVPTIPSTSFPDRPTAAGFAMQLEDMLIQTSVEEEKELRMESSQVAVDMQGQPSTSSDEYDAYFMSLTGEDLSHLP